MSKCLKSQLLIIFVAFFITPVFGTAQDDFRITPYLQNPAPDAMTILWFSEQNISGSLSFSDGSGSEITLTSTPVYAEALAYPNWEVVTFFSGKAPEAPYCHRIRLTGLKPNTVYNYMVEQGAANFSASFKTAPRVNRSIRFIVYADCETEPESTGKSVKWPKPDGSAPNRIYLLDQTTGYANNLEAIRSRQPDFIVIPGDLVQHGGEQRGWDEFWLHNTNPDGTQSLAGQVPILAAPGNHDYYEGSSLGQYNQPGSERAVSRFLTYFKFPANGATDAEQEGRYYRLDYGPVTIIALDVANESPHKSERDTNFYLLGENDSDGGFAPSFSPGSHQYEWLETQLEEAQKASIFTFVMFHHVPYSVGPHGWPAGNGDGLDTQSGVPVRILTPLFLRYGVDAVFCGHDEIWERSEITGTEILPNGSDRAHIIHFYDVGTGGDGLRGPQEGLDNPYQKFLAHTDAPETWENGVLVDGGKHYGHLEVDVVPMDGSRWQAELKPVYIFPLLAADGTYKGYERRVYNDVITLTIDIPTGVSERASVLPDTYNLEAPYPNPFNNTVFLRYSLPESTTVKMEIYDQQGQKVRLLIEKEQPAGSYRVEWDGMDEKGTPAASGVYLITLQAGSYRHTVKATLMK